jgi:hypothetical protein
MIGPELAAFLEQGVGIHIGTRDDQLHPNGARAVAAKVDSGGSHLVVYVAEIAAARLRSYSADPRTSGRVKSKAFSLTSVPQPRASDHCWRNSGTGFSVNSR